MARKKHKSEEIEAVLKELEALGWSVVEGQGHAWGLLRCPINSSDCRCGEFCQMSVWSTPKDPERHAKKLRQKALACTKQDEKSEEDD